MYLRNGALWRVSDDPCDPMYLRREPARERPGELPRLGEWAPRPLAPGLRRRRRKRRA
jgi:hypothetical protein